MHELFGETVSSYSRAQAIADGVLVDITAQAKRSRFVYPVAMTSALWDSCKGVGVFRASSEGVGQILSELHHEIKRSASGGDQLKFVALGMTIKCVVGPGDDPAPVITLMLENED